MIKFLLLALSLIPFYSFGQVKQRELIHWSQERKLQWSDFKYRPPMSAYASNALTAVRISVIPVSGDKLPNYRVSIRFNKNRSWTNDSTSTYLLSHEQHHFDIYEVYSRKIRAKVLELRALKTDQKELYLAAIEQLLDECEEMHTQYDRQTANGFLRSNQLAWQDDISRRLGELKELSSDSIK